MIDISNNSIITLHQGDCGTLSLSLNAGTILNPRYPKVAEFKENPDSCKLCFSLMEPNQKFEDGLVRKYLVLLDDPKNYIDEGEFLKNIDVYFESRDTECLLPGLYYYGVKAIRNIGGEIKIDTIIKNTKLYILE